MTEDSKQIHTPGPVGEAPLPGILDDGVISRAILVLVPMLIGAQRGFLERVNALAGQSTHTCDFRSKDDEV